MLVYDCEILRSIPCEATFVDGKPIPNIEYCQGWKDFPNMGIAVVCAHDTKAKWCRVYTEHNLDDFQNDVDNADFVAGFNNLQFDNKLCAANDIFIPTDKSYDLLTSIWFGMGLQPVYEKGSHDGYGLHDMSMANLGMGKTGNGAYAPILWQQNQIGKVINYCLNDVRLTTLLIEKAAQTGHLLHPIDGKKIPIYVPAYK